MLKKKKPRFYLSNYVYLLLTEMFLRTSLVTLLLTEAIATVDQATCSKKCGLFFSSPYPRMGRPETVGREWFDRDFAAVAYVDRIRSWGITSPTDTLDNIWDEEHGAGSGLIIRQKRPKYLADTY